MIKSTKTSLTFANTTKKEALDSFIQEYQRVVANFVDKLWDAPNIPRLLPKELTCGTETWLSARIIQCAGKQASGIVRGTKKKQEKRMWQIKKFIDQKHFKKARILQKIYDAAKVSKPNITEVQPELDSRFVKIDLNNATSFDGWLTISSLGNHLKIILPFKKHKHFNRMLRRGTLKSGVRLSSRDATFMFDIVPPPPVTSGIIKGIDIGQTTALSCSDGQVINEDPHGHTYMSISEKLARKQKNSKAFHRAMTQRLQYLHWIVKQLNLLGVKEVNREDIKYMRKGKKVNRRLSHWNYGKLFDVLDAYLVETGVQINKRNPTYTSQRCFPCGWVHKRNRKGKIFKCEKCGFTTDSDLNAAGNLSLPLMPLTPQQCLPRKNRTTGFYWTLVGQEPIVPATPKTSSQYKII